MALSAGKYEVVSRVETPECSLRLIRLGPGRQVEQHFHEHSTQVYFVLSGEVEITVGREQRRLQAQQSARVPPFMPHGVGAMGDTALLLSISVPPLAPQDQHPVGQ